MSKSIVAVVTAALAVGSIPLLGAPPARAGCPPQDTIAIAWGCNNHPSAIAPTPPPVQQPQVAAAPPRGAPSCDAACIANMWHPPSEGDFANDAVPPQAQPSADPPAEFDPTTPPAADPCSRWNPFCTSLPVCGPSTWDDKGNLVTPTGCKPPS